MLIRIVCMLMLCFTVFADDRSDSKVTGNDLGKTMVNLHGSSGTAKETLYNPLLSSDEMSTLAQSWKCPETSTGYVTESECNTQCSSSCVINTFDFELQCTSQTDVLNISPVNFVSGGEVQLSVKYDSDLDGIKDKSYNTLPISGFCTNGYVSCTPSGSWSSCKYYEFGVTHKCGSTTYKTYRECKSACSGACEATGTYVKPILRSYLQMEHLGGCFCSNASCGSSFNSVFSEALGYFGGGITSHLMTELGVVISDTEFDMATMSIKYMAADPSSCTNSEESITDLKKSYQTGDINYGDELVSQMADSSSVYSLTMAQSGEPSETNTCSIVNTPLITPGTPDTMNITVGKGSSAEECSIYFDTEEFFIDDVNNIAYFVLSRVQYSDWMLVKVNGVTVYVGPYGGDRLILNESEEAYYCHGDGDDDCLYRTVYDVYNGVITDSCDQGSSINAIVNIDILPYLTNGTNSVTIKSITAGGVGYAYLTGVTKTVDTFTVQRSDGCFEYENDDKCRLYEEVVNNEYNTVKMYNSTGISAQSKCDEHSSSSGKYIICDKGDSFEVASSVLYVNTIDGIINMPDNSSFTISTKNDGLERYRIERTYICDPEEDYDFSDAKAQADTIGSTLDRDSGDFTYLNDGAANAGNIYIESDSFENCTYSCVVRTGDTDTEVFPDQATRPDTNTQVVEERPCGVDKNTLTYTCPYESSSETLLEDCSCTDHFTEVISLFGSLYDAAKDLICSQD